MSINFSCPECREPVSVSDALGGLHMQCPHCSARIMVPEAGTSDWGKDEPAPGQRFVEDEWGEPRDWGDRGDYGAAGVALTPEWGTVRQGLTLIYYALIMILFALLAYVAVACLTAALLAAGGGAGGQGGVILLSCAGLAILLTLAAAAIMWFVGLCMLCFAPRESGAKGLAIGSLLSTIALAVLVISLVVYMVLETLNKREPSEAAAMAASVVIGLVGLLAHILFILFLRAVAEFFHNSRLAGNILIYLWCYVIFSVASFGAQFFMGFLIQQQQNIAPGLPLVILVAQGLIALVLFVCLIVLVNGTRTTVGGRTDRRYPRE